MTTESPTGDASRLAPASQSEPVQENDLQDSLLDQHDAEGFMQRWLEVQAAFVDDPQSAVQQGDALVAEVMQRITAIFEADRLLLERSWSQGENSSTEELRVALQRYRSFFQRLLAV